jgi:SAM-dependent methyltransferase
MQVCPVCGFTEFSILVPAERLESECRRRERFVSERLPRPASPGELKDLTEFFHQGKAEILDCLGCTLLVRKELEKPAEETYKEEAYDAAAIERIYPRYLHAFRSKADPFRSLLPAGARVLEIGSHYGAFLQVAGEWSWHAEGVDIGKDTSRFARSKGFTVHTKDVSECGFGDRTFDGVFVWNCFEQIREPMPVLEEARRILRPGGLLVLRTPNGVFYRVCQSLIGEAGMRPEAKDFLIEAMAYNNLLGFPYLFGYSEAVLERLAERSGFRREGMLNSELLTLPLPEDPDWVRREERVIADRITMLERFALRNDEETLIGPWIELWFRRD